MTRGYSFICLCEKCLFPIIYETPNDRYSEDRIVPLRSRITNFVVIINDAAIILFDFFQFQSISRKWVNCSLVHSLHGHLPTDSLNFEKEYYDGFNAYIRSKLAIVIMSRHLSRLVSVHGLLDVHFSTFLIYISGIFRRKFLNFQKTKTFKIFFHT